MRLQLPAELLGRPSPEETSAKGRNAAQPPHFADLDSSTFRRDLVLQAARRTAPAVALVPGTLFVPTDISAPTFGAAARPVACRPSIRLRRVPAGRRLLQHSAFFGSADFRGYLVLQAASATAPAERLRKNVHECTPTKRNLSWALTVQPRAAAGSASPGRWRKCASPRSSASCSPSIAELLRTHV